MRKSIVSLIGLLTFAFLWVGIVHAAPGDLSVKVSQPKTPVNQNSFDLNVVTLDILDRPITVKCYKKAPLDAGFSQFGSDMALAAGGNSANCTINSSVMPLVGTYQFYVTATADTDTVTSDTISVEYKVDGPETPTEYSKEKSASCTYKIKFKTADDAGRTSKVEIYRSENTSFNTDSGTRVGSVNIGSNTQGEFLNDVADCNRTYYYAIRAFDSIGNGSGVKGDSETHTTTILVSPTPGAGQGAIAAGTAGNVLGQIAQPTPEAGVLGEATPEAKVEEVTPAAGGPVQSFVASVTQHPVRSVSILGIILAILYYVIFRSPKP